MNLNMYFNGTVKNMGKFLIYQSMVMITKLTSEE